MSPLSSRYHHYYYRDHCHSDGDDHRCRDRVEECVGVTREGFPFGTLIICINSLVNNI